MKPQLSPHLYRGLLAALCACSATAMADSSWELVFNDEFSSASFTGETLNWDKNWNKIKYASWDVADWRKYQSTDDALVTYGEKDGTDYVTLKGVYGDYTSQSDQDGSNNTYACGGIFSDETFTFQYGYVEVRARFESETGCWPAIWLMPINAQGGWPACGEIDIMEHINSEDKVHQTLHFSNSAGIKEKDTTSQRPISDTNGWQTYGLEWTEKALTFYVDGELTRTYTAANYSNWPFSKDNYEFYLMIDQQIGGSWTGDPSSSGQLSADSVDFDIDYVRVYSTPKNATTADYATWGTIGPLDANGSAISYTTTSGNSGVLDQSEVGNYHFEVNGAITRLLAEGSNIKLSAKEATQKIDMSNAMVQADSLYIDKGEYKLGGTTATLDVDSLFVVGGSLQIDSDYALSGVKKLYLGMETDAIGDYANRNASLYFTANQSISADVELVDDSKIAVFQGNTVDFTRNVTSDGHTLNLVGVYNKGIATIRFSGENNKLSRVSMGVEETVNGHTFNGCGQVLDLRFGSGSNTEIGTLLTNSPDVIAGISTGSKLSIESKASLNITKKWTGGETANNFDVEIADGGKLTIGNGKDEATANSLTNVTLTNRGTLHIMENASLNIGSLTVDASKNADRSRATLQIDGSADITTLNINGKTWTSIGTLKIANGYNVNIGTIYAKDNGQVDIVVCSGTAVIGTLVASNAQPFVINAENYSVGTFAVNNTVKDGKNIHVRYGRAEFRGGLSTTGTIEVLNDAVVQIKGSAGSNTITLATNSVLETAGDYSDGTVDGSGTIRKKDSGTAKVNVNNTFKGTVDAQSGSMSVRGSSTYNTVKSKGTLTFLNMSNGMDVKVLNIDADGSVSVYLGTEVASGEAAVTVESAITFGSGALLNADLVLNDGVKLELTGDTGLEMGSSITLKGTITLGDNIAETLRNMAKGDSITLAYSMDGFTTGDSTWEFGASAEAQEYFSAEGVDMSNYRLSYYAEDTRSDSGVLELTKIVPEPAGTTLSLLALAAFCARRRRASR